MLDSVNPKSAIPIHRQIGDQIRRSVAAGLLEPGDQLPSVRELAARLLVNPNTVAKVYRDLERDGLLETRRGQGTFISPEVAALAEADRRRLLAEQLEAAARDVHAFGLSEKAALDLFREVLANRRRGRQDKQ
ncbi:MAG: GntR family transcriptional regulator [Armatimonadota bacterium]|nr:MAG: GntR family transcriptional regulator [Armatimonadota bacterium]